MEIIILYAIAALFLPTFLMLFTKLVIDQTTARGRNLPPSPPSLPIIGHLHLLRPPRHLSLNRLAERYGPVVFLRLGSRPAIVVSSPAAVEEILTKHDTIFANHPRLLAGEIFGYDNTTVVFTPYGQHWRNLRRITNVELLSTSSLNISSGIRTEEIRSFVKRLSNGVNGEGRGEVELRPRFYEMAYNAVSKVVAGKRYLGDDVTELEEARRFKEIIEEIRKLLYMFNPGDFFPALESIDLRGLRRKMVKVMQKVEAFADCLIEEHKSGAGNSPHSHTETAAATTTTRREKTLLDVLISLQENDPHYYTDDIVKGLIVTVLAGGTDGLVEAIESVMLLLLSHPEILKKARAEIDFQVGQGRVLDESDLPKLSYLHCIIQEALRLSPPGQGTLPRESSEDCTIQGFHVPRGTILFIDMWGIQRDPKLWDEPTRFMPERFAGAGKGGRKGFNNLPFGSGRRMCPGEGLAMRMMELTIGAMVQCFEWETVGEEEVDLNSVIGLTVPKGDPFVATYIKRDSMIDAISQL